MSELAVWRIEFAAIMEDGISLGKETYDVLCAEGAESAIEMLKRDRLGEEVEPGAKVEAVEIFSVSMRCEIDVADQAVLST